MSHPTDTQDNTPDTHVPDVFDALSTKRVVQAGLRNAFPDGNNSAKRVAKVANVNHRTLQGWRAGRSLPSLPEFFNLYLKVPGIQAEMRRLAVGADDPARTIHEIQRLIAQYEGRP